MCASFNRYIDVIEQALSVGDNVLILFLFKLLILHWILYLEGTLLRGGGNIRFNRCFLISVSTVYIPDEMQEQKHNSADNYF